MTPSADADDGAVLVTVLVPARNEADDIAGCIACLAEQDHPLDRVEVIVVDGGSSDGTADRAADALALVGFARAVVLTNRTGTTPSNLNHGLEHASGAYLCRVDARSLVPPDYVRRCVAILQDRPEVAVVGGRQVAQGRAGDVWSVGIARALNNRWGMGLSRYRRAAASGPADTVYLGAFRTAELGQVGGWDERLTTNQDFDLNRRLATRGLVWFESGLDVRYLPRSDLAAVVRQYHRFGRWKVRYWRMTGDRPQRRQRAIIAVPLAAGVATLLITRLRPRRLVLTAASGVAAVAVVDAVGGPPNERPSLGARLVSVSTLIGVWTGWASGVYRETLVPTRPDDRPNR